MHKYTHPSTFVVAFECTGSERSITAQEIITIEEPVAEIGEIRCFAGNLSFYETNCRALHGAAFQIQIKVKAGRKEGEHNMKYVILPNLMLPLEK